MLTKTNSIFAVIPSCVRLIVAIATLLTWSSIQVFAQESPPPVFWTDDCEICDRFTVDGQTLSKFETDDFVLIFKLSDAEKFFVVTVGLSNKSDKRIEFDPEESNLVLFKKDNSKVTAVLDPMSPEVAAKKIKNMYRWSNFAAALGGAFATQEATVSDNMGNTATITVPDDKARDQSKRTIEKRNTEASTTADTVLEGALRSNTVFPNATITGNISFPRQKGVRMIVAIKVNDVFYSVNYKGTKTNGK